MRMLQKQVEKLTQQRDGLKKDITDYTSLVNDLKKTYDSKIKEIKEQEKILEEKEDEVANIVVDLENKQKNLDVKEMEIVEGINKLEEDRRLLESKENEIVEKVHEIEDAKFNLHKEKMSFKRKIDDAEFEIKKMEHLSEQKIKKKMEKLEEKETEIKEKSKILKQFEKDLHKREEKVKIIEKLKVNKKLLQKEYDKLVKNYMKTKKDYLKIMSIKEKEEYLEGLKRDLERKEKRIYELDKQLLKGDFDLESEEPNELFSPEPKDDSFISFPEDPEKFKSDDTYEGDIHTLIEETRSLIEHGLIGRAKTNLSRMEELFDLLDIDKKKKQALEYDFMELENALKLAQL